ncbi:DUF1599 domain-containing protein [Niabella sp. W65]|nr:DUF1599 domain-containing protein [Niabella sp. W65]MCH7366351.1 DUF1599 domain-containing protein [Niabella sp. W65]ULT42071.1 DUF1599 domain-containing protein [Niabella sp. I65]
MIADDIAGEFLGMINYAVIGLIQLELPRMHPGICPKNRWWMPIKST